jgi:hypothetical protein
MCLCPWVFFELESIHAAVSLSLWIREASALLEAQASFSQWKIPAPSCTSHWARSQLGRRKCEPKYWSQHWDWITDILNFFALLNLSNYNKDGSPEAPHSTWVLLEEKKAWGRQEWSGRNLLGFWLRMFEWFLFAHIVTPPLPPPFLENWGNSPRGN